MSKVMDLSELTRGFYPNLPKAYEKSVVLGGARVLFPCLDPEKTAEILTEHTMDIARRAYNAGRRAGKLEIRKALFD